jgi:dihydrofolate synthase/folylpolyglutamate synthase
VQAFDDVSAAFDAAHQAAAVEDRIVIFGSFLTVADVMRAQHRQGTDSR